MGKAYVMTEGRSPSQAVKGCPAGEAPNDAPKEDPRLEPIGCVLAESFFTTVSRGCNAPGHSKSSTGS